ncbi:hypothetical protein BD408DRAFT_58191 [Parasitella parasitica]|nr:hypothetical protein BD408DRAFT_58191 [Parasitella parasitica]
MSIWRVDFVKISLRLKLRRSRLPYLHFVVCLVSLHFLLLSHYLAIPSCNILPLLRHFLFVDLRMLHDFNI